VIRLIPIKNGVLLHPQQILLVKKLLRLMKRDEENVFYLVSIYMIYMITLKQAVIKNYI